MCGDGGEGVCAVRVGRGCVRWGWGVDFLRLKSQRVIFSLWCIFSTMHSHLL